MVLLFLWVSVNGASVYDASISVGASVSISSR